MSLIKTYKVAPVLKLSALAADYEGQRFGKLTVKAPTRRVKDHVLWLAECDCGTQVEVRAHQLANGTIDSCGKCQTLKRITLQELPYTLINDEKPEQQNLPLEDPINATIEDVVSSMAGQPSVTTTTTTAHEATREEDKFGAWDAAIRCCKILDALNDEERAKARQLIDVQLGALV